MQSDQPLVSIIVRTKNRPELLREALDSLAAQTYSMLEVIVVNDGGQEVEERVLGYRSRFASLQYLSLQPARGRAAAGNAGLEAATGEYLGFLDDDDWLLPEHVAILAAALAQRPEKAVYSGVRCVQPAESNGSQGVWREVQVFNRPFDYLFLCCGNYIPIHAVLFERSLLTLGCRLDEALDVYEDWDFWLQAAEHTRFYHCPQVTAYYRLPPQEVGSGIHQDAGREQGRRRIWAKWRSRWSEEIFQQLLEQAGQGLALADRVEKLHQELVLTRQHVRNLEKERELTCQHVRNLEQTLASVRREFEQRVAVQQQQIVHWQGAYQAVLASTSWRVTAPLRSVSRMVRRLSRWYRYCRHGMRLEPVHDLQQLAPGQYRACGPDPYFLLHSERAVLPCGWVWIEGRLAASGALCPVLYFDSGEGFTERDSLPLIHLYRDGRLRGPVRLPETVRALRLDPGENRGDYLCEGFSIREIGVLQAAWFFLRLHLASLAADPRRLWYALSRIKAIYRQQGLAGLKLKLTTLPSVHEDYANWLARFGSLGEADRVAIRAHVQALAWKPLISILMPVYNPQERWLRAALESVLNQLYPYWELCIADDASSAPHVKRVLEEYCRRDPRIKVVYRQKNGHISVATNDALALASGAYVAFLDHDDELAEHALYWVAVELNRHPEAELIYTDEDKIDAEGNRFDPYFKPDWNPLLLCGQNYLSHLSVYRTERIRALGGFRQGVEGSQDWDLALRVSECLTPKQIRHIPLVLYHWRAIPGSTAKSPNEKDYAALAAVRAVAEHLDRCGRPARVDTIPGSSYCRVRFQLPPMPPKVSLIIPTRDGYDLLQRCVETLLTKTDYPDYEVIVVDNRSQAPNTLTYLDHLAHQPQFQVLRYDAPFNFSAINNYAVRHARGEILGFLNNDLEILTADWLAEMVSHAVHPETGAVGAMLYYPDGRIQHAGVILGVGGVAGHAYQGFPRGYPGQMGRAWLAQNLSAVTAACLVIRRQVFDQVGGFDEELPVAFNDVDLCLKLQSCGYRNVWTPVAQLTHHESASRGCEDTPEKQARFQREVQVMQRRWGKLLRCDPAYNPNLTLERCDFSISDAPRVCKPWFEVAADLCGLAA